MDNKSRMERLTGDECELDDWYYNEDDKGKAHIQNTEKGDVSNVINIFDQLDCRIHFYPVF